MDILDRLTNRVALEERLSTNADDKLEAIRSELMRHLQHDETRTGQAPPPTSPAAPALRP